MKQHILSAVKFVVFLALGCLLVWLAVKDLTEDDKAQIYIALEQADYMWVVLSVLIGILAHLSRAVRWKMLLAPLGLTPKLSTTFYAVMIGYVGNLAINRLGEVLRCTILKRYEKIPFAQSFGTVIAERVIDVIVVILLFIISAWIEYEKLKGLITEKITGPLADKFSSMANNPGKMLMLAGIGVAVVVLVFVLRKKILNNPLVEKIRGLIMNFAEGLRSVTRVKNPALFIFHSLFIWAMYLIAMYACVFAFAETRSMTVGNCLVLMCFASLGVMATPGGIGAYQWIVLQVMMLWGYSAAIGVAFGWVAWLSQTVTVLLVGLTSFGLLALRKKEA